MRAVSFISAVLVLASGASATAAPSSDLGVRSDVAAEEAPKMIAARYVGNPCKKSPKYKCLARRPVGMLGSTEKRAVDVEELSKRRTEAELNRMLEDASRPGPVRKLPCARRPGSKCPY